MQLTNRTAATAELIFGERPDGQGCVGMLVAKVTFRIDGARRPQLDTESPVPVLMQDLRTPLGLLPRDDLPRTDRAFEVIVLGRAHARSSNGDNRRSVALTVGSHRRELSVFGDRQWRRESGQWIASPPASFHTMDLTWENAFGGRVEVLIDRDAWVEVVHPHNPVGKGFDPTPSVTALADELGCPDGYPKWPEVLALPNVEHPGSLVTKRDDAPLPECWATLPMDSALHVQRAISRDGTPSFGPGMFHRAHPAWVIEPPPVSAEVRLEGFAPDDEAISFALPSVRVIADYAVGARSGRRELFPHMLVLLPEERRFYLVFRRAFSVERKAGEERAFRLRMASGWRPQPEGEPS